MVRIGETCQPWMKRRKRETDRQIQRDTKRGPGIETETERERERKREGDRDI